MADFKGWLIVVFVSLLPTVLGGSFLLTKTDNHTEEPETWKDLFITPTRGHMLGGTLITISGPKFSTPRFQIEIGDYLTTCYKSNDTHAKCITGQMFGTGLVDVLYFSETDEEQFKGKIFLENPLTSSEEFAWIENRENYDEYHWDHCIVGFDMHHFYDPIPSSAYVTYTLYGYKEYDSTIQLEILFSTKMSFSGSDLKPPRIKFQYSNVQRNGFTSTFRMGLFQIASIPEMLLMKSIWTRPIPLAFIYNNYWNEFYKPLDWASMLCRQWFVEDKLMGDFAEELPRCSRKARAMKERTDVFVPDKNLSRYIMNKIRKCYVSKTPNKDGTGQQCCYNSQGDLIDVVVGHMKTGLPARAHPFGVNPYDVARKVPGLSHWHHDYIPYLMCCKWAVEGSASKGCNMYKQRRTQLVEKEEF